MTDHGDGQAYDPHHHPPHDPYRQPSPPPGYPQPGQQQLGYPQPGQQQPGYPPPAYPQPGQQQPGQPYSAWSPYPGGPPPPVTPPRRRLHPAVIAVAVVVVVAAVVGTLLAVLSDSDVTDARGTGGRSLAVPARIAGYRPVAGVDADDLKADLGQRLARDGDDPDEVVRHAAVAVLEQVSSGDRVVVIGIALRDIRSLRSQVRRDGVESSLKFFLGAAARSFGGGGRTTAHSAGPLGGFLRCASGTTSGEAVTACAWGDESAFALTLVGGGVTPARAAATTRELRARIESR